MTSPFESLQNKQAALQAQAMKTTTGQAGHTSQVFQYSADIGVGNAVPYIESLEMSSGIVLANVSDFRAGDPGYHGMRNAVDFAGSAGAMRDVAAYMYRYFPFWLELIHTDDTVPGGGYYVHNGQKVAQSFYDGPDISTGGNIIDGHRDHIHAASTVSAMQAAASATPEMLANYARTGSSDLDEALAQRQQGNQPKGCFKNFAKITAASTVILGGSVYGVYHFIASLLGA